MDRKKEKKPREDGDAAAFPSYSGGLFSGGFASHTLEGFLPQRYCGVPSSVAGPSRVTPACLVRSVTCDEADPKVGSRKYEMPNGPPRIAAEMTKLGGQPRLVGLWTSGGGLGGRDGQLLGGRVQ